jgi:hypothetical protein
VSTRVQTARSVLHQQTVTESENGPFTLTELGAYGNGSWNLASLNDQDSYTNAFSTQQSESSTKTGTDSYSSTDSGHNNATVLYGGGTVTDVGTVVSNVSGHDSFTDSAADTLTQSGTSTYTLSELGVFSNLSYGWNSITYQGGESYSETFTSADPRVFTGSENDTFTNLDRPESGQYVSNHTSVGSFTTAGTQIGRRGQGWQVQVGWAAATHRPLLLGGQE